MKRQSDLEITMARSRRRKIIVSVAPVGDHTPPGVNNPLRPKDVAENVVACAAAGASMVHLHVRDETGNQTSELTHFSHTLDLIRLIGFDVATPNEARGIMGIEKRG